MVAIVFGGGGTPSPSTELVVELAALAALVAWVWLAPRDRHYPSPPIDWPLLIMATIFAAIPLLQLVPLPPGIWHHLPGREVEVQALALIGRADSWMPLSESPPRTIASVLSLIPPLTMLFMVSRLRGRDRITLIGIMALLGLAAATIGVLQLASGNVNWFQFYGFAHGFATGFQANRNADADVLLIACMAATAWTMFSMRGDWSRQKKLLLAAGLLFLVLSVVLTGSRTGVALILIVALASAIMLLRRSFFSSWKVVAAALLGLSIVGVSAYVLAGNARVARTLARFDTGDAIRPEIWKDTIYGVKQRWPVGSGVGTFQPIFSAAERLEFVRPDFSNRAHDDYLEFALEAGIVAPLFVLSVLVFAGMRLTRMLVPKADRDHRISGIFVLGSLLVLLLHSLVDYPERSLSLAVVTGLLAGLLGRAGVERSGRRSEGVIG